METWLGIGILLNTILGIVTFLVSRKNATLIRLLEINTNSIKDALVRVTGESEHAKGMLAGRIAQKANNERK